MALVVAGRKPIDWALLLLHNDIHDGEVCALAWTMVLQQNQ